MSSPLLNSFNVKWASRSRSYDAQSGAYRSVPDDEKSELSGGDDDEFPLDLHGPAKRRTRRLFSVQKVATLALCVALAIVTALHIRLRIATAPPPRRDCGLTLEDAQAHGCTFDQLSKTWLPPECPRFGLDQYLAAGYNPDNASSTQWPFYHDRDKTLAVSIPELADMAWPIENRAQWWTSGREHLNHCTWLLIRMSHVYTSNERRDILTSDFHHTMHCAMWLRDRAAESPGIDEIRVIGNSAFGFC